MVWKHVLFSNFFVLSHILKIQDTESVCIWSLLVLFTEDISTSPVIHFSFSLGAIVWETAPTLADCLFWLPENFQYKASFCSQILLIVLADNCGEGPWKGVYSY